MSNVAAPAPSAPAPSTSSTPAPAAPAAAPTSAKASPGATPSAAPASTPAAPAKASLPHGGDLETAKASNDHPDAKPGETKAETIQRLKFKVKVRGQEMEREYTPEEAQLYVQKGHAFDANAQETASIKKTFQSFVEAVKQNPFEAFKDPAFGDLGSNFKQLVIDQLAKEFQGEELKAKDPREYELNQLREEKARWEAAKAAEEKARHEAAQKESDARMWAETKKVWDSELEKAGFSSNPFLIQQMAQIGLEFDSAGLDLSPQLLVAELRNRMAEQQRLMYGGLKGESLAKYLGDDVVNEILQYKIELAKKGRVVQEPIKTPEPVAGKSPGKSEKMSGEPAPLRSFKDFLRSE